MSFDTDAKEFDCVRQRDGDVFIECLPSDAIVVPAHSTLSLLQVVLAAIRVEGSVDKIDLAKKIVMGALGR